jgi:acetoacetyl-CoA synthetase
MSDTTASDPTTGSADLPLWTPDEQQVAATQLDRFRRQVRPEATDSDELWRWSVDESDDFWASIWDWCEVLGDRGQRRVDHGESFWTTTFLPDATLNVAENLLADRPGAGEAAIIAVDETESGGGRVVSRQELRNQVAAMAAAFRAAGVEPGDRVAAWMPHRVETVVAFLAAASIGAVFTSTSADFGVTGVLDRFGQTEPKVLVAADGYHYGGKGFPLLDRLGEIAGELPSLELVVVVGVLERRPLIDSGYHHWSELLVANEGADPEYTAVPVNHPLYILYSSGTTGRPKCIVHRSGGVLLKHLCEQRLHCDVAPGDTVFYFTTCGWMMWNWLVSCLGSGATIVLYDGNPAHPGPGRLFELVERHGITLFGISAKYVDSLMKAGYVPADHHDLSSVKTVCSTGSPLSHEAFRWIYGSLNPRLHLASIAGGTDLCGCLVLGDPTKPVYAGEIQTRALGMAVDVFDDGGRPLRPGNKGELVCTQPFPSMPLEFWNDPGHARYRAAYFERFDRSGRSAVWAHGDFAAWTDHGGMIIFGRSDATLNASGVRIGTAEIYRIVEQLPEVAEAIAVAQEWDDDTRIVLFVRLVDDASLTAELEGRIRTSLRSRASPRHVPAVIAAVDDIPRTRSGKIVELAVTEVVHGREVKNREALANPEALDQFANRPELR